MDDRSLDKKSSATLISILDSSLVTVKKVWQTPHLTEMDYSKTSDGVAGTGDLGGRALS